MRHLPGFIDHLSEIKSKGVDLVVVIAFNDAWVMSAWAKANNLKEEIVGLNFTKPTATADNDEAFHDGQ